MNDLDAQPIELSAVEEKRYISVLLQEKDIDLEQTLLEEKGCFGLTISMLIDFIYNNSQSVIQEVENMFRYIDFKNGDVMDYVNFLAKGMIEAVGCGDYIDN